MLLVWCSACSDSHFRKDLGDWSQLDHRWCLKHPTGPPPPPSLSSRILCVVCPNGFYILRQWNSLLFEKVASTCCPLSLQYPGVESRPHVRAACGMSDFGGNLGGICLHHGGRGALKEFTTWTWHKMQMMQKWAFTQGSCPSSFALGPLTSSSQRQLEFSLKYSLYRIFAHLSHISQPSISLF